MSRRDDVRTAAPENLQERITKLFEQLRMPLYRYLLVALGSGEEAEDGTQECFLRLCRHLRTSGDVSNERLWLFHVAHNLVLDRKRSGRAQYEVLPADWNELGRPTPRQDRAPRTFCCKAIGIAEYDRRFWI